MDDRTRQGRNPEWRLAFEDRLGADARTHIRRAVKRGQGVPDPDEAAVAAGLTRREQRAVRWWLLSRSCSGGGFASPTAPPKPTT
jgi:hypothetical protein